MIIAVAHMKGDFFLNICCYWSPCSSENFRGCALPRS